MAPALPGAGCPRSLATRSATEIAAMRRGCVQIRLARAPRPPSMAASSRNCGTCAAAHSKGRHSYEARLTRIHSLLAGACASKLFLRPALPAALALLRLTATFHELAWVNGSAHAKSCRDPRAPGTSALAACACNRHCLNRQAPASQSAHANQRALHNLCYSRVAGIRPHGTGLPKPSTTALKTEMLGTRT